MCDFKEGLLKGKRVLIVEEDAHMARELAAICLNIWSAQGVGISFDAETAFEMLTSGQKYDLVIIEVVMAKNRQDGLEVRNCRQQIKTLIGSSYAGGQSEILRRQTESMVNILTQHIHELIKAEHGSDLLRKFNRIHDSQLVDSVLFRRAANGKEISEPRMLILTSRTESVDRRYFDPDADAMYRVLAKPASMLDLNEAVMELFPCQPAA